MRMFKKGQFDFWMNTKAANEPQFIHELFEVYAR